MALQRTRNSGQSKRKNEGRDFSPPSAILSENQKCLWFVASCAETGVQSLNLLRRKGRWRSRSLARLPCKTRPPSKIMETSAPQEIPPKKFSLIKCLWAIFKDMDRWVHDRFMRAFPRAIPVFDAVLEVLFGVVTHPAFALIAAALLGVLVLTGVIKAIVFCSILFAWAVAVLWIARAKPVRALTVTFRSVFIGIIGVLLAVAGNSFGHWALNAYNHEKAAELVASDKRAEPKREEPTTAKPLTTAPPLKPTYLSAQCSLPKDFSPCEIKCSAYNPHDTPMPNVSVGFNGIYPYQTRLAAGTETHMLIKKQETLPLPMSGGHIDQNLQAFSVEIPLIPPKTSLSFTLWTLSEDNQKACAYLKTTIRTEQRRKIDQLVGMDRSLDADRMASLQAKKTSLYVPGYFMSSEGKRKIEFVTNQEERNAEKVSTLYAKVSKTITGKTCLIPIFSAERSDGGFQYFANAPPMMTWVFNTESMKQTANRIETDPHPPANYACEDK
jgi:hypothetical protein